MHKMHWKNKGTVWYGKIKNTKKKNKKIIKKSATLDDTSEQVFCYFDKIREI